VGRTYRGKTPAEDKKTSQKSVKKYTKSFCEIHYFGNRPSSATHISPVNIAGGSRNYFIETSLFRARSPLKKRFPAYFPVRTALGHLFQ
jgi:hypothetical protein